MPAFAKHAALLVLMTMVTIPLALWIYQVAQFGGWQWNLERMSADRIVATSAKAIIASVMFSAMVIHRNRIPGSAVRNSQA